MVESGDVVVEAGSSLVNLSNELLKLIVEFSEEDYSGKLDNYVSNLMNVFKLNPGKSAEFQLCTAANRLEKDFKRLEDRNLKLKTNYEYSVREKVNLETDYASIKLLVKDLVINFYRKSEYH